MMLWKISDPWKNVGNSYTRQYRPGDPKQSLDVINVFKNHELYVIGVPKNWRSGEFSKPGFIGVYNAFHMLSPWGIGSLNGIAQAKNQQSIQSADVSYCNVTLTINQYYILVLLGQTGEVVRLMLFQDCMAILCGSNSLTYENLKSQMHT